MILVRLGFHAEPERSLTSEHNMWTAIRLRVKGHTLGIASTYLPPREFHMNSNTIYELGKLVTSVQIPWLVGGDFNNPPQELRELHCPPHRLGDTIHPAFLLRGPAIVPTNSEVTCSMAESGSLLDYAIGLSLIHI